MAKLIGSDCDPSSLQWQFRRFKAGGKLQAAALKNGQDPKDINVDVNHMGHASGGGKKNCSSFLEFCLLQHSTFRGVQDSDQTVEMNAG